jgi:hypothetical protein
MLHLAKSQYNCLQFDRDARFELLTAGFAARHSIICTLFPEEKLSFLYILKIFTPAAAQFSGGFS